MWIKNQHFFLGTFVLVFTIFANLQAWAQQAEARAFKLGMLLPLSGPYAAVGTDSKEGIELAQSELTQENKLNFVFADSKGEASLAVTEFKRLLDVERVSGVYALRGPAGMAVNPLSRSAKIPLLGGVGNKNFALSNEYAFQLWARSDFEGEFIASVLNAAGLKKIAIITVQDDYFEAVSDGLRSKAESAGLRIVYDQETLPTESDFRTQVNALRRVSPDAVFINLGLHQIATFITQMKQLGIDLPIYSNFFAGKKEVVDALGSLGNGVIFAEMSTKLSKFREDLKTRFNSSPSAATLAAYLATLMLAQAVGPLEIVNSETLHASLLKIKEIRTTNGNFVVKDRFVQFPMALKIIRDGAAVDLVQ